MIFICSYFFIYLNIILIYDRVQIYNLKMLKSYLKLVFLIFLCTSLDVGRMTKDKLDALKQFPDYVHHLVFFSESKLEAIRSDLEIWAGQTGIRLY